jgi:hypothetical protein
MRTAEQTITDFRYKIGDNGTSPLFDNPTLQYFLNEAVQTIYGISYSIGAIDDSNYARFSDYAEYRIYYRLAKDTAFYFKYSEAMGDSVDQTKTPDYFLKLANAKYKEYMKTYGNAVGEQLTGGRVGVIFNTF